jgi:3-deoxy-D-manno-octulosonic-acid transferase
MDNFPIIQEFYHAGAAVQVNEDGLSTALRELLLAPDRAREIGLKAQHLYRKNAGAVERAMQLIGQYIEVS